MVTFRGQEEEIRELQSHMEKHVRYSGESDASAEDQRDRRFAGHLDKYYDEVILAIHDAQSILIFGPGEAKGELKKRIESKGLKGRIVAVETADEMTDPQIAAKVRQHFLK